MVGSESEPDETTGRRCPSCGASLDLLPAPDGEAGETLAPGRGRSSASQASGREIASTSVEASPRILANSPTERMIRAGAFAVLHHDPDLFHAEADEVAKKIYEAMRDAE
jgi:hypothetical protein